MIVLGAGCAADGQPTETVTLVMADGFSSTHPVGIEGSQPFIDYVNEHGRSVGLRIDAYSAGALGSSSQIPTLLRNGVIDLGYVIPANVAEELPLAIMANLPGLAEDTCAGSDALMPMMRPGGSIYDNELVDHGFQAIWGQGMPNMEIMTTNTRVESPRDAAGLLIASNGGQTDRTIDGLGASAVSMEAGDYYEGLARNVVDGVMTAKYASQTYGLADEIGYSTLGANLGVSVIFMSIRDEVWDELNADQRQVLIDAGQISQRNVCDVFAAADAKALTAFEEAGVQISEIDEDDRDEWDRVLEGVRTNWVDAAESRDIPAREALDEFSARLEEVTSR